MSVVKESKSDSSFFSQSKPKAKLPSFKKAPAAPISAGSSGKRENEDGALAANIAQPSAIDPFQEALKSMQKNRKGSPMQTNYEPPPTSTTTVKSEFAKSGKKRKSVTWAPDSKLEQVKLIEKAIYDDDPMDVSSEHGCIEYIAQFHGDRARTHRTRFAIWRGLRVQRCMPTCSRKQLIGMNQ